LNFSDFFVFLLPVSKAPACYDLRVMGWLADNRERVKARIRKVVDWRQTATNPPYLHTVLYEWTIAVRPKDGHDVRTCKTVKVSIQTKDGLDDDFYECPRYEVLG